MKSWNQFQNKHEVKLNEVFRFSQNKWLEEGDKTINTLQVSVQSQSKNVKKIKSTHDYI